MKNEVFIPNISEDVWSFIQSMHEEDKKREIAENVHLADRDLWTLPAETRNFLITPSQLDAEYIAYFKELYGTEVEILTPKEHSGEICIDIANDSAIVSRLVELGNENTLTIKSYSASYQFYMLLSVLRSKGISIDSPESPLDKDSWVVNFFGSKSGIRQTTDRLWKNEHPWMTEGYISYGVKDIAAIAADIYTRDQAVALKIHKGHAGAGIKFFRMGDLPTNYQDCRDALETHLKTENYWQTFPVIVETFMDIDEHIGGGNPNAEYYIDAEGKVRLLYPCGMRVNREGIFMGIEIHRDVLPDYVLERLLTYGEAIGTTYRENGYRGYFEVDCVYTKSGQLLITESNVRRTGGTHVYHTAKRLIGDDFMDKAYVLSNNIYPLRRDREYTFSEIHSQLTPVLYDKQKKEGLIIASASGLQLKTLAYIIIGQNKDSALEIEGKMGKLLEEL